MKKVLISVILPIYNSEKTLPGCIESILDQTLSDYELLLINDGSTDNSLNICYEYKSIDQRITIINQERNKGVAMARNLGIENANGQYIVFIDNDDLVYKNHLDSLYYSPQIPLGTLVHAPHLTSSKGIISQKDEENEPYYIQNLVKNETTKFDYLFAGSPWSKLYETHIIKKYDIRFTVDLNSNDDHLFSLEYLMHIDGYKQIGQKTYVFADTPGSLTKRIFPFENHLKFVNLSIPLTAKILEKFRIKDITIQTKLYETPINALLNAMYSLYITPCKKGKSERLICLNEIVNSYELIFKQFWKPNSILHKVTKQIISTKKTLLIDYFLMGLVRTRYSFIYRFKFHKN
jgi:glycosyltransferase involved in cell wall biosynthesis